MASVGTRVTKAKRDTSSSSHRGERSRSKSKAGRYCPDSSDVGIPSGMHIHASERPPHKLDSRSCRHKSSNGTHGSSSAQQSHDRPVNVWSLEAALDKDVLMTIQSNLDFRACKDERPFAADFKLLREVLVATLLTTSDQMAHQALAHLQPGIRRIAQLFLRSRLTSKYGQWLATSGIKCQLSAKTNVLRQQDIRTDTLQRHFHSILKKALLEDLNKMDYNNKSVRKSAMEEMQPCFEREGRSVKQTQRLMEEFLLSNCAVSESWMFKHLCDTEEVLGASVYLARRDLIQKFEAILRSQAAIKRQTAHRVASNVCAFVERVHSWVTDSYRYTIGASFDAQVDKFLRFVQLSKNPKAGKDSEDIRPWKIQSPWPLLLIEKVRLSTLTSFELFKAKIIYAAESP